MVQSVGNLFYAVNTTKFAIAPNLATNDFEFENFVLYPIQIMEVSKYHLNQKPMTKSIYNSWYKWKNIYNKTFQNSGKVDQELLLNNISSGLYLVTIQNGE
jgi:hypothetical protein